MTFTMNKKVEYYSKKYFATLGHPQVGAINWVKVNAMDGLILSGGNIPFTPIMIIAPK